MDAIVVGRLRRAHGLNGELFASAETGDPELVFAPGRVFEVVGEGRAGGLDALTLTSARPHKGGYLLRFEEIPDRETAERVRGLEIAVEADTLRPLEENEFFLHELVGLEAWRVGAERVGPIREVYELGGQVLLGIEVEGEEKLVPFRRELVSGVDRDERRVWIDPPPGLLDL
jgi:16S rRNA processing protein RimM